MSLPRRDRGDDTVRARVAPNKHPDDSFIYHVAALRGLIHRTPWQADPGAGATSAVGLEAQALAYMTFGRFSTRYTHRLGPAWGTGGLQGGAGVDLAFGIREPLGPHHGPVARAGLRAHYFKEGRTVRSLLELPQLQVGYQKLSEGLQAEAGGRAGWVWAGVVKAPGLASLESTRVPEWGGYAALTVSSVHLGLEATRMVAEHRGSAEGAWRFEGLLCGVTKPIVVCLDGRWLSVPERPLPQGVRSLGLSIGLGESEKR